MLRVYAALATLLMTIAAPFAGAAPPASSDTAKFGKAATDAFYARQFDVLWDRMTGRMRDAIKSRQALAAFGAQVGSQLGSERELLDETSSAQGENGVYERRARFDGFPGAVLVRWVFDKDGQISGMTIQPDPQAAAPSAFVDYQSKTMLRLPFKDDALVFWGGRELANNAHAAVANQRYALDLLVSREQRTHSGEGKRNDDYFCFGRTVLAPASGKLVTVLDAVDDNVPGQMNRKELLGNHVVIDHGNGEFSLLAHLRRGSLVVKQGEKVGAGQALGECGNSGNSSEPHLHYQLQNGPMFGAAAALPAQFVDYLADGQPVARGEPVKGQTIKPAK